MVTPSTYGDRIADIYDDLYGPAPEEAIDLLCELASPGGTALELGIGTGRMALPLRARGIDIHGVDASQAMVDRLRAKPGGGDIPVTIADFADVGDLLCGTYDLVFCVFNTFFALLTQEAQVKCFEGVNKILRPQGKFLLELFVPDLSRFERHQPALITGINEGDVVLDAAQHDLLSQRVSSRAIIIGEDTIRVIPVEIRYAWPSELDLMARLAGFRLANRWADWDRTPFGRGATKHISVYEKV